jgi:thymidylate synthase
MALHIKAPTISHGWSTLLYSIIKHGDRSAPREQDTLEITNVVLEVENGLNNIFFNDVRDLNYRFMIAEWLWILAGLDDVESLSIYNKIMRNFSDDGQKLSGAYGPRLAIQWEYIIYALSKSDSRQAVATIWTPNPTDSKDIPCTISLQWYIRQDLLHCTINMRSSDVWLGLPYDFFTFSQLTNWLSTVIKVPVGSITMCLASSHLYDKDKPKATECVNFSTHLSLSSPVLPDPSQQPSNEEIKMILKKENGPRYGDSVWGKYALALKKDKATALEILYELDPNRQTIKR